MEPRNQRLTNSWEGEKVYTCVHTVYSVGAGEGGKCREGPREHCKHETKVNVVVYKQWDYGSPIHVSVPTHPGIFTCSSACVYIYTQAD